MYIPTSGPPDTHMGSASRDIQTSTSVGRVTAIALPDEARALIESDAIAHVVTLDEDGSPQITAAWVGLDGDEIVIATLPDQRKLQEPQTRSARCLVDPVEHDQRVGSAGVPGRLRNRPSHRGRCAGGPSGSRAHVSGSGGRLPELPRPATGICHEDNPRTPRWRRTVEPPEVARRVSLAVVVGIARPWPKTDTSKELSSASARRR